MMARRKWNKKNCKCKYQIVGVKNSIPIIGCEQDTLSGAYMLTFLDVKLKGTDVANILCNTTTEFKKDIDLNKIYSGQEIFSFIIGVCCCSQYSFLYLFKWDCKCPHELFFYSRIW